MSENTQYNISSQPLIANFMTTADPPTPNCSVEGWSYDI